MTGDTRLSGTVIRTADNAYYFIPDGELEEWRVPADATRALEDWMTSSDVAGHQAAKPGTMSVLKLASDDPDADALRAALDTLIGPEGIRRRCLNVIPADLLELIADVDRQG